MTYKIETQLLLVVGRQKNNHNNKNRRKRANIGTTGTGRTKRIFRTIRKRHNNYCTNTIAFTTAAVLITIVIIMPILLRDTTTVSALRSVSLATSKNSRGVHHHSPPTQQLRPVSFQRNDIRNGHRGSIQQYGSNDDDNVDRQQQQQWSFC